MADILVMGLNLTNGRQEAVSGLNIDNTTGQLISLMTTGTAPFDVTSTTVCTNLNADTVDGQHLNITSGEQGDVLYFDGSDWVNLHHGTDGQFLKTQGNAANPIWANVSGTIPDGSVTGAMLYWNGSAWTQEANFLATGGNSLEFNDTIPLKFGTGGTDDQIAASGTNTLWTHVTGNLTFDNTNATGSTIFQLGTDTSATGFYIKNDTGTNVMQVKGDQSVYIGAGTGASVAIGIADNAVAPFTVWQGTDNYITVQTSNGGEGISFGNATTDPSFGFNGDGTFTQSGIGQVSFAGNVNASNGVDVNADSKALTVGAGADWSTTHDGSHTTTTSTTGNYIIDNTNATGYTIVRLGATDANCGFYVQNDTPTTVFSVLGTGALSAATGNFDIDASGNVTDGTWQADAIANSYGGTGQNSSGWTGVPYVTAGTWSVDTNALDETHGGTGLTSYATGDLIYASSANTLTQRNIGSTGAILNVIGGVPAWTTNPTAAGDLFYWNGSAWTKLASGASGTFLTTNGSVLSWGDPGAGYTWTLAGDSGTPQTISDGDTGTFTGGNGITTAAGATDTLTITADVDGATLTNTGGGGAQLAIATDGIQNTHLDLGTTGTHIYARTFEVSNLSLANYTAVATTYNNPDGQLSVESHLKGIDNALGAISSGLVIKGNTWIGNTADGSLFNDTDGVRQHQAIIIGTNMPAVDDTLVIKSTAGTETWTFKTTRSVAYQIELTASPTENIVVANAVSAINTDSSAVFADWDLLNDIQANRVLLLGSLDANTDHRTWYTASGSFAPKYSKNAVDAYTDFANLPTSDSLPNGAWAAFIAQATLLQGWTYVIRAGEQRGAWMTWDDTNNHWSESRPHQDTYAPGDGIEFVTQSGPDLIQVDLAANSGLAFSTGDLTIDLDGSTLALGGSGISINLGNSNTWTAPISISDGDGLLTDVIQEYTADAGVTVDGCTIENGFADQALRVGIPNIVAGETATYVFSIVYLKSDGEAWLAKADAEATGCGTVIGVAATMTDGSPILILTQFGSAINIPGEYSGYQPVAMAGSLTLNVGDPVFVSNTVAGCGTNNVSGYGPGEWIQQIGVIMDTTGYSVEGDPVLIALQPYDPILIPGSPL